MQTKKAIIKSSVAANLTKNNKKYIPTPEEANIIINYFLHNNFQDFNTWQQISKSKCQFQFNQTKTQYVQCKVTLKWDDTCMPTIVQIGKSKHKKNAKKKALQKLVQNLLFLGFISYGFKDSDFVKKLPKRRKQSSEDQQSISCLNFDQNIYKCISNKDYEQAVSKLTYKNFQKFLCSIIKEQNLKLFIAVLRKLQNIDQNQKQMDIGLNPQDIEQQYWQNYQESQLRDPFEDDLVDILRLYQQSQLFSSKKLQQNNIQPQTIELPTSKFNYSSSKISLQFFHPIEFTLINRRNFKKLSSETKQNKERSDYFNDFYRQISMPIFENEQSLIPLPYKVIQRILRIILEFSFDYKLAINLLSIFQRQVTACNLECNIEQQNEKFYLKHVVLTTAQFAYLLNKKFMMLTMSIEGLINIESNGILTFTSKQPQQITSQKLSKKFNTSEIQEMQQFANEQIVLLVSKVDRRIFFIAQIIQCWPTFKLKSISFQSQFQKQKIPFTMYKLANSKLYNRLLKSIAHTSKNKFSTIKNNSFVILHKPTEPLLLIIVQLVSEWIALNETILIVSQNFNQICTKLIQKGYKAIKITHKVDQRNIVKKQIVCCSPVGVCADVIKNYAYTRVLIQGAQRVSQTIATLALDKGFKKLYLIGDPKLPPSSFLSSFARNRKMNKSIFQNLVKCGSEVYEFKENIDQQIFDNSILKSINYHFYNEQLDLNCNFQSPSIKGFPWPSDLQRIAFIQTKKKQQTNGHLLQQVRICCKIIANVIKSGFITINEIACRVSCVNSRALVSSYLYNMLKKYPQIGINCEIANKCIQFVTGSRFRQRSLCILIGQPKTLTVNHLIGALQEGRRGLIVISDFSKLKNEDGWSSILGQAFSKKLMLQNICD